MELEQATVRVADVAESIVARYLYGVVGRMSEASLPIDAWFRITTGSAKLPLEEGEVTPVMDPSFEVMIVVKDAMNGLATTLTMAAAEMPGRVTILPQAVLEDTVAKQSLVSSGWKQTAVPRLAGVTPEFVGA